MTSGAPSGPSPAPFSRLDAALRVVAALLGTLPLAALVSVCLARHLPLSRDAAFAIAYVALIPTWITAMCLAFLARSGLRCLLLCAALSGLLAAVALG